MTVTLKTPEDIAKMRVAGKLAADVLEMIAEYVSRVIRMRSFPENTVSTVSSVSDSASGADSDRQP